MLAEYQDCVNESGGQMLSIYLGDMEGAIYHPPTYFDNMDEIAL